jgi:hypothetical protein
MDGWPERSSPCLRPRSLPLLSPNGRIEQQFGLCRQATSRGTAAESAAKGVRTIDTVLLRKPPIQTGVHPTTVRADLRRRGYEIHRVRTVASQWAHALSRPDADRWLRERLEMTLTRRAAS